MHGLTRRALLAALAPGKLRALIVDGENNHDWPTATRALSEILTATGRFEVRVSTSGAPDWRPPFASADVVILNYNTGHLANAKRWSLAVEETFLDYLAAGGGVVIFHAANNAFLQWAEYNQIIGLGWREPSFGPGVIVNQRGKAVFVPPPDGPKPGHGPRHDFTVTTMRNSHPLSKGMPRQWTQQAEQLTHGQHGPAEKLTIISYAWSKDSLRNEPMEWTRPWGKGRVYTTMFGHTWKGEDNPNLRTPGFRATFARGVEWAATGRVTLPPPPAS
jgi:uncharacterized protein